MIIEKTVREIIMEYVNSLIMNHPNDKIAYDLSDKNRDRLIEILTELETFILELTDETKGDI